MNAIHAHLILVHIPAVGPFVVLALLVAAAWRRSRDLWIAGLLASILVAVAGGATYLAGEAAEETAEHIIGTSEALLEAHEEAAVWALVGLGIAGAAALVALAYTRMRDVSRTWAAVLIAINVMALPAVVFTANAGGQIRHGVLRTDSTTGSPADHDAKERGESERYDDD